MIYKNTDGTFCISSNQVWMPGCYADKDTALVAFSLPDETLKKLQDDVNQKAGGSGGVITCEMIMPEIQKLKQ